MMAKHTKTYGQTADDLLQVARIKLFIERLENGDDVTPAALASVGLKLKYQHAWQQAKRDNAELRETPSFLQSYTDMLRKADALNTAYMRGRNGVTEQKAQAAYERALEHLEEIVGLGRYAEYLDRAVDFSAENYPSLTAEEVPRVFNSKSHYVQNNGMNIGSWLSHKTKRDVKLEVLWEALTEKGAPHLKHGRSSRLQCGIDGQTQKDFKLETLEGTLAYLSLPQEEAAPKPPVHETDKSRFNHLPLLERLQAMRRAGMLG